MGELSAKIRMPFGAETMENLLWAMLVSYLVSDTWSLPSLPRSTFSLSLAIVIHSLYSLEMPSLASAFSSALLHVICGQTTGRECATQPVNNCRGQD